MWWWFLIWVVIIWLLLSGGTHYGYRRSYYSRGPAWGILLVLLVIFILVIVFAGPYWGYYGNGYYGR